MPLRSILRRNNIMMVVVVHMLSQLLNVPLATNFVVSTDDGLFTRRNVYITVSTICAKNCRI